jgi:hypothetical protein
MRQWINRHPIAIAVACVAAAVGVWFVAGSGRGDAALPEDEVWYHDVVTGRVFPGKALQIPPIRSPAGNEAVRVFFASCGQCTEAERFPAFYMRFTDEMKRELEADPSQWANALGESHPGRLYSSDTVEWVEAPSVKDSGVAEYLRDKCPQGKWLQWCR